MSVENNDKFVIFPSKTGNDVTTLDVGYFGSHGPRYLDDSGRQHGPTEPGHGTVRCSEVDVEFWTPGPGRKVRPSTVKVPCSTDGPPGAKVNGPGKFVETCTQVGVERSSQEAVILGAEPALVSGDLLGVNSGTQQPASFFQFIALTLLVWSSGL